MSAIERSGNIFNSQAEAIVVTVNCVGYMGKGMALECALRFPEIEKQYKDLCENRRISIGRVEWMPILNGSNLILFPTKDDYKFPSKYSYIDAGLKHLVDTCKSHSIKSIAVPRLGSELGGLDWERVRPMVLEAFQKINIELELWSFGTQGNDPLILSIENKLNLNPLEAAHSTGINSDQIEMLLSFIRANGFLTVTDLLSIKGLGKSKVKKLVKWAQESQLLPEPTLFD